MLHRSRPDSGRLGHLGGQALEGGSVGSILQPTAALIVLGGTFGACLLQFQLSAALTSQKPF